jgi:hypothetical protein
LCSVWGPQRVDLLGELVLGTVEEVPVDPRRVGPDFATPCDFTGEPHPTPAEPDDAVGIRVEVIFVWMDADGLRGARLRS